ncbi:nucleotidyltransferase [Plantactinospora sp. BC1]|uniref:nucleotidyltransferase domain-containing protein n=1 Tax=Plantactinospora sp. BC1 TaxID=2108470 RepID=UPI000D15F3B2|nr:nucleotidyltransferase domain-containing protein [Plantactinospora sp. BC1]AVT32807.1 nucleotidyltransferase [Plantactinospora sp. BC1]
MSHPEPTPTTGDTGRTPPAPDLTRLDPAALRDVVADQPYPLLFATVSGAHLYGFPSRDSDVDLRGVHLLPAAEVVGLRHGPATVDRSWTRDGVEIDLVTHDAVKFGHLLLRRNGYVLEQLLSPLVVLTGEAHAELVALAPACLTRHHAHHYRGFAQTQRRLFDRTGELKPLLYTFRTLLTGIHLMRTGRLEAHLPTLRAELPEAPGYLGTLVAAKAAGEHDLLAGVPEAPGADRLDADLTALHAALDEAQLASRLPERPAAEPALHDLLVRIRLATVPGR